MNSVLVLGGGLSKKGKETFRRLCLQIPLAFKKSSLQQKWYNTYLSSEQWLFSAFTSSDHWRIISIQHILGVSDARSTTMCCVPICCPYVSSSVVMYGWQIEVHCAEEDQESNMLVSVRCWRFFERSKIVPTGDLNFIPLLFQAACLGFFCNNSAALKF